MNRRHDTRTGGAALQWTLDALGNWEQIRENAVPTNRTHDAQNRITSTGFTHSNNGEMRIDASGQTYVMSPVYVDAIVLRDSDTDGSNTTGECDGTDTNKFEQRVYVLNDANYNVTGLVGDTGDSGSNCTKGRGRPCGDR